ncbi:MAG: ATP-binding protein [Spirochaetes bacterium]|nr:ATP-binding protein [Spirochaetota bacterium]
MENNQSTDTIPFDRMKESIEKEVNALISQKKNEALLPPAISFEQGKTRISFSLPFINDILLISFISIIKEQISNIRVHHFENGYYAFQALNSNLFRTENILDNIKIEFSGITTNFKAEISKKGNLAQDEINLVLKLYKAAFLVIKDDPYQRLSQVGASVISGSEGLDWSYIAGYEEVKRSIKETIILPLKNPDIYDSIAKLTRQSFESNRPKAILFEGSPGVGKTTVARIIASEIKIPLVYVPIESIMSKWYGQSSQNLAQIFDACEDLGGAILFLDEIDSLAGSRNDGMFEATRRILSVLLRRLDGIDSVTNTITIGATNRKSDLDHALISRFDQTIHFPLPNEKERAAIFSNYAKHLNEDELKSIVKISGSFSGRNIKDICEFAERRWVRKLIIKNLDPTPPPVEYYKHAVRAWIDSNKEI